jgi:hypothetical protein
MAEATKTPDPKAKDTPPGGNVVDTVDPEAPLEERAAGLSQRSVDGQGRRQDECRGSPGRGYADASGQSGRGDWRTPPWSRRQAASAPIRHRPSNRWRRRRRCWTGEATAGADRSRKNKAKGNEALRRRHRLARAAPNPGPAPSGPSGPSPGADAS